MTLTLVKMHWIRDDQRPVYPRKIITHCGREGWAESGDEFTDGSNIFEATDNPARVKCGRCLKSMERIHNGAHGCVRASSLRAKR